jgi:hypothetical protein
MWHTEGTQERKEKKQQYFGTMNKFIMCENENTAFGRKMKNPEQKGCWIKLKCHGK